MVIANNAMMDLILISLHTVFPIATGVNTGGICEFFQTGHFLGCQLNLSSLSSLDNVALLGGSDDGYRALGDGPGDTDLRATGSVFLADGFHLIRQYL